MRKEVVVPESTYPAGERTFSLPAMSTSRFNSVEIICTVVGWPPVEVGQFFVEALVGAQWVNVVTGPFSGAPMLDRSGNPLLTRYLRFRRPNNFTASALRLRVNLALPVTTAITLRFDE